MKKLVLMAAIGGMVLSVQADVWWSNTGIIINLNGDPLPASDVDPSIGCFAQLVYTGANGMADLFDIAPVADLPNTGVTGVTFDDVVVATMFCGQGASLDGAVNGIFPQQEIPANIKTSGDYYVRVFSAPGVYSGTNAVIRRTLDTYYWDSPEYTYTYSPMSPPDSWDFAPAGAQTTLPTAIPEPAALGLGIIGLISLRLFSRKRK
jgi:hypothetical protein